MATREISQLPSTNVSNDTDLLMTRQGSQDRAVQVDKVRNVGTESGQALGVGGYGIGGDAISITSLYASNNANLIDRSGVYAVAGATNVPVAVGELKHWQTSATEATQEVIGQNQEAYFRKKVAGTWLAWVLYGAANKQTVRDDLDIPSNDETLLVANRLQEIEDAGAAAKLEAIRNLIEYSEVTVDLGGEFAAGSIVRCSRFGNIVTITATGVLAFPSDFSVNSSTGIIPSKYRPQFTVSNVYTFEDFGGNPFYEFEINAAGTVQLTIKDSSGTVVNKTNSRNAPTISYVLSI